MKPKHIQQWKEERKKGMLRHVLIYGVFGFGLPFSLVFIYLFLKGNVTTTTATIIFSLALGIFMGLIYGIGKWKHHESEYLKAIKNKHDA